MPKGMKMMGIFPYQDDFLEAVESAREARMDIHSTFSPTPSAEMFEVLHFNRNWIRYITLVGALLGAVGGYLISAFTALQWKLVVWGKPVLAWIPFSVIAYEWCLIGAAIFAGAGVGLLARLVKTGVPAYYDPRFGVDRFGILVATSEYDRENVARLLREHGAEEVYEVSG
jgi:molybdopterin-containing oxidoreductase family membrane subunit